MLLLWQGGTLRLRLVECKASRKDRTHHRIQLVLYRILVRQLLEADPLVIRGVRLHEDAVECVVARLEETTGAVHDLLTLPALDLAMEEADARQALAPNGPLQRILDTPLDALPFHLDARCDDCALHVHCLPEAARQRRLELLGLDPSTVRALQSAGVPNLDALADLDGAGAAAARIRSDSGFTENLDRLCQKARARRRMLPGGDRNPDDHEVIALANAGDGQLPAHDPNGQRPPREADLLHRFFTRLVRAIQAVSKPDRAVPLHFYVWSRHGITRLMEACARADTDLLGHLRELLGCRQALEQLIYSCLEDEVQSRYALGWTGRGLIVAAGLKWFGRRFHWTRRVNGEEVALDRVFAPTCSTGSRPSSSEPTADGGHGTMPTPRRTPSRYTPASPMPCPLPTGGRTGERCPTPAPSRTILSWRVCCASTRWQASPATSKPI